MRRNCALAATASLCTPILIAAACGGAGDAGSDESGAPPDGAPPLDGGADPPIPPEEELESTFGVPTATGRFVWVANPTSGQVAYIDATTFAISLVEAGHGPTHLAPIPSADVGVDAAIVLNVLSSDATLLRHEGGQLEAVTLPIPSGGNGWAVSPSGRFATAWTDAAGVEGADPIDGYQDVTVLDLTAQPPTSTTLAVGYRPSALSYDGAEDKLFSVTQDGISVIDLEGDVPVITTTIAVAPGLSPATDLDVSITHDGAWALVRAEQSPDVRIISLTNGEITTVSLPSAPTDLDLSPGGDLAIAVLRNSAQIALLEVPAIATNPDDFTLVSLDGEPAGSVSFAAEAPVAFLYSAGVPSSLLRTVELSALPPVVDTIELLAPILAVLPTRDAAHVVAVHDAEALTDSKYHTAVSLVPIASGLPPKIFGLDADVSSIAMSPDADRALVATQEAEGIAPQLFVADLSTQLLTEHPLASRPISAGIVAEAARGFVAQEHPEGRLTFVDFATGELRTLTGFELATQVVQGQKP